MLRWGFDFILQNNMCNKTDYLIENGIITFMIA